MAVPDATIEPRILASARKAFLANGYEKTSLKAICKDAGVTTGALYKRYKGKEDLFCALVKDAVEEIEAVKNCRLAMDMTAFTAAELYKAWDMYDQSENSWSMQTWFDFLYARKDEFTLLLTCAGGTRYASFLRDWVNMMTEGNYQFHQECVRRGMIARPVTMDELRVLLASFWTAICEPFLNNFSKEQLDIHCELVCRIFNWYDILGLHMPD